MSEKNLLEFVELIHRLEYSRALKFAQKKFNEKNCLFEKNIYLGISYFYLNNYNEAYKYLNIDINEEEEKEKDISNHPLIILRNECLAKILFYWSRF